MTTALIALSFILIFLSLLPFVQNQHWVFRVPEFLKLQLLYLQTALFITACFYLAEAPLLWYLQGTQLILMGYHVFLLMRYTKFWRTTGHQKTPQASSTVKIVACNVYQPNQEFHQFIELIQKEQPDIFLTMESNGIWEKAMRVLENEYPYVEKATLENTYGMHFYSRLKVNNIQIHYFVADDLPSLEAELETEDGQKFVFFGVHPPPPSPTEEETSKERDGDLLCVAKKVRDHKLPVLVAGDFNNVAWAKSSILFKKTSRLIDARIGRGILATFHAKYWFFRIPVDLVFHSPGIFIDNLCVYPSIGSDHFPVGCTFYIDHHNSDEQEDEIRHLEEGQMEEVEKLIAAGKLEESDNRD